MLLKLSLVSSIHLGEVLLASAGNLSIVTESVLDSESVFVTFWLFDGVMESFVSISNSWDILWGVNYIWIIGVVFILYGSSVESFVWIIKIKPIGATLSWNVEYIAIMGPLRNSLMSLGHLLSRMTSMMELMVMFMVVFEFDCRDLTNKSKNCEAHCCFHHFDLYYIFMKRIL